MYSDNGLKQIKLSRKWTRYREETIIRKVKMHMNVDEREILEAASRVWQEQGIRGGFRWD